MRCKLGFSKAEDGELLVLAEVLGTRSASSQSPITVTRFSDENVFLYYIVLADLDEDVTTSLISNVLLTLSEKCGETMWTVVDASERQVRGIGIDLPSNLREAALGDDVCDFPNDLHFRDVLMQAPTPVTMLAGPQHEFSFVNPAYVRLMGRTSVEDVVGKTVREVLPELLGQPFFGLLDNVYRSGEPYVGTELPAHIKNQQTGEMEDLYFDFVYHPVRDHKGDVCGILCHANDVTERVLARFVSGAREAQLYRQWAELEAIYRNSPVGLALVDTREYRFLRINEVNAAMMQRRPAEIIGQKVFDIYPDFDDLREIYARVVSGEVIRNVEIDVLNKPDGSPDKNYLLSFSPVFGPSGRVEAVASTSMDITHAVEPEWRLVFDHAVEMLVAK